MQETKFPLFFAVSASILSLFIGILSGVGFFAVILRSILSGILFFIIGFGLKIIIEKFLPELLEQGSSNRKSMSKDEAIDIELPEENPHIASGKTQYKPQKKNTPVSDDDFIVEKDDDLEAGEMLEESGEEPESLEEESSEIESDAKPLKRNIRHNLEEEESNEPEEFEEDEEDSEEEVEEEVEDEEYSEARSEDDFVEEKSDEDFVEEVEENEDSDSEKEENFTRVNAKDVDALPDLEDNFEIIGTSKKEDTDNIKIDADPAGERIRENARSKNLEAMGVESNPKELAKAVQTMIKQEKDRK